MILELNLNSYRLEEAKKTKNSNKNIKEKNFGK